MPSTEDLKSLRNIQSDKKIKKAFKIIASKNPDKYFPTRELRKLGYMRKKCVSCGTFIVGKVMTKDNQNYCKPCYMKL